MKKIWIWLLALVLTAAWMQVSLASSLQNAWYMHEELNALIGSNEMYEAYSHIAHNYKSNKQEQVILVLSDPFKDTRLLVLERDENGSLVQSAQYLSAVCGNSNWQGDEWTVETTEHDGFILRNLDDGEERYMLSFLVDETAMQLRWYLSEARTPKLHFTYDAQQDAYWAEDADWGPYLWQTGKIALDHLSLSLLPDSLDDIWKDNMLRSVLPSLGGIREKTPVQLDGDDKMAVYAAPSAKAFRGANGKACVYENETMWLRGVTEDGGWWLVEYYISDVRGRTGYIKAPYEITAPIVPDTGMEMEMAIARGLTDAPYYVPSALGPLKQGDRVICLGYVDAFYAYVEAELNGKTARGYVPLQALALPDTLRVTEIEEQLPGTWRFSGGAEVHGYGMIFEKDGGHTCLTADEDYEIVYPLEHLIPYWEGTYAVYPHDNPMPGWWSKQDYLLTVYSEAGFASMYGLSFRVREEDGVREIDLYEMESGGSYEFWK